MGVERREAGPLDELLDAAGGVVSRDDSRQLGARVDVLPPFAGG